MLGRLFFCIVDVFSRAWRCTGTDEAYTEKTRGRFLTRKIPISSGPGERFSFLDCGKWPIFSIPAVSTPNS